MRSAEDDRRYTIRAGFERDNKVLQYRKRGEAEWNLAHWCDWDWVTYDYRLKPEEPKQIEVAVFPMMSTNGLVAWVTESKVVAHESVGYRKILRFVTRNRVRHAVLEVK